MSSSIKIGSMKENTSNFNSEVFWKREYESLQLYTLFRVKEDTKVDQALFGLKAELKQSADQLAKLDITAQRTFAFRCIDRILQ